MPALASIEELSAVFKKLEEFKKKHPKAAEDMVLLLKSNRNIGYKNICKMLLNEATPESLKE